MKFDQGKMQAANQSVSREDVEKIYTDMAVYSNKYFITIQSDGMVRMSFAEVDPSGTFMNVRATITMPYGAFASLAQLVNDNMNNLMKMQQSAQAMQNQLPPGKGN